MVKLGSPAREQLGVPDPEQLELGPHARVQPPGRRQVPPASAVRETQSVLGRRGETAVAAYLSILSVRRRVSPGSLPTGGVLER